MPDPRTHTDPPTGPSADDQPLCARARALSGADPSGADPSGTDPSGTDPSGADPSGTEDTHDEVVALLRRAVASGEPDAVELLAVELLGRGERHAAIEVLAPAVHGQGRAGLAGLLGDTLARLGDHDGAETAFLVGLDADDVGATNDYGVFLRDRGRTQEAAYVLDRAARAGDDLAALNLVALHLEELDDLPTATAIAEDHADDARPSTLVALADVRLAAGRVDAAEELYRRAAELGGACAHIYYGWFLQDRREDLDGAERELRRAREVGESGATFHLARFLHDTGHPDEALPLLEEAAYFGDADAQELIDEEYTSTVDRWDD